MIIMLRSIMLSAGALALALVVLATAYSTTSAQQNIAGGDNFFCDASFTNAVCTTTVTAGDTVTWNFGGAALPHTTTFCGNDCDSPTTAPLWDSGIVSDGSSFSFTFSDAGTYLYFCTIHPTEMRGQIVVEAAHQAEPTAGSSDGGQPDASATAGPAVAVAPTTGFGPSEGSSAGWWLYVLAGAGLASVLFGATGYRLARR